MKNSMHIIWHKLKEIHQNHRTLTIGVAAVLIFVFLYKGYHFYAVKHLQHKTPIVVSVATAIQKNITVPFSAIGTVAAYQSVSVKSQTDGQIIQIPFHRGQMVQAGQLLFVIDPRSAQAQLQQAKAILAKDQAQLQNAQRISKRDKALIHQSFVSQAAYDQDQTNEAMQAAAVQADEAAMVNAELQLAYSYIRAPISGRTGDINVDTGNIVKSAQYTTLTTINELQPIYISFSIPQSYLSVVSDQREKKSVPVSVKVGKKIETGWLSFVDNQINTATGTVALKATFPNDDLTLWPGQYIDVSLPTTHFEKALVVPATAVQQGPNGSYVFLVKPNSTVSYHAITTGPVVGEDAVILEGLKTGDQVITAGQLQLIDGSLIAISSP